MITEVYRLSLGHQKAHSLAWRVAVDQPAGLLLGMTQGLASWSWEEDPVMLPGHFERDIGNILLKPDGSQVWGGSWIIEDGVDCWNLSDGSVRACPGSPQGTALSFAWDQQGQKLYFGTSSGLIYVWHQLTDQLERLPIPALPYQQIQYLALSGRFLAWVESVDNLLHIWDLASQSPYMTYELSASARFLRFDGSCLHWAEAGKTISLYSWDLSQSEIPRKSRLPKVEIRVHSQPVQTLAISPDFSWGASASSAAEPKVLFWEPASGELLDVFDDRKGVWPVPVAMAFSPDSRQLALVEPSLVRVLSLFRTPERPD